MRPVVVLADAAEELGIGEDFYDFPEWSRETAGFKRDDCRLAQAARIRQQLISDCNMSK